MTDAGLLERARLPRALPRSVRVFPDESVESFIRRLSIANRLDAIALRDFITGSRKQRAQVPGEVLSALSGVPEPTLRYAMPELAVRQGAVSQDLAGRALPWAAREAVARRDCAAVRAITELVMFWQTHENVVCPRHHRWLAGFNPAWPVQLYLRGLPEMVRANLLHRRLIRRHGRRAVQWAFVSAAAICTHWYQAGAHDEQADARVAALRGVGAQLYRGDPAHDAAAYPQVVALTRLLVSPNWRRSVVRDHLPLGVLVDYRQAEELDTAVAVRFGYGPLRDASTDQLNVLRGRILLARKPHLAEFAREVRRTVAPRYEWDPFPERGALEPLAAWIQDLIRSTLEPDRVDARYPAPHPETIEDRAVRPSPI